MPIETESNPFEGPLPDFEADSAASRGVVYPHTVKKFNEQILALGALWIILGVLGGSTTAYALYYEWNMTGGIDRGRAAVSAASSVVCAVWIVMGVLTCRRVIWAVRIGLILTYVLVLLQVLSFAVLGAVLGVFAIMQGHRVLGWAERMQLDGAT